MYAKKSLGQHFLTSQGAIDNIIDAGDIVGDDTILEIGPGKGVLTEKLVFFAGKVIAVEKDDALFELLKEKLKKEIKSKKLELINADILDYEPTGKYKLIANIPYNITGAIFKKFLSTEHQPERTVMLVQKEVAERIVAKDKKESILSLSVKAYGQPKYIQTVKAGSFSPAPKVDSAIISIENISKEFFSTFSEEDFFTILRAGFKSKRKKLSSNIATVLEKEKVLEAFKKLNLDENLRAEDLNVDGWKKLAEKLF